MAAPATQPQPHRLPTGHRPRPHAVLLAVGACAALQACAAAPAPVTVAPNAPQAHVHAAGAPLPKEAVLGQDARIALFVTNDGDVPVLLLGVTPQAVTDDAISLVERLPGHLRYDAQSGELVAVPGGAAGRPAVVHRGLLLPGEALELYTSVVPLARGQSVHDFRLDYIALPEAAAAEHLFVAQGGSGRLARTFRRPSAHGSALSSALERPRLRRAVLADGNALLTRAATRFQVVLPGVRDSALPLDDAYRIAGVRPGCRARYSAPLEGWVLARERGCVLASRVHGRVELPGVSFDAVRTMERHGAEVPIVFGDVESYEALKDLLAVGSGSGPQLPHVERSRLLELLRRLGSSGMGLTCMRSEVTLTGKEPATTPLLALVLR